MMRQKTILCYGDSNTWGYIPMQNVTTPQRYARHQRWTGRLQQLLGQDFYVIEEGLNSRTTNLDYQILPDRNGKTYLPPCLYSHAPIDLIILALGGNDLKTQYNRSAEEITAGLAELITIIQSSLYGRDMRHTPEILILPPPIFHIHEEIKDLSILEMFKDAKNKALKLPDLYEKLAQEKNCYYLDITKEVSPSALDGIHFDEQAHEKLAYLILDKLNMSIFKKLSAI